MSAVDVGHGLFEHNERQHRCRWERVEETPQVGFLHRFPGEAEADVDGLHDAALSALVGHEHCAVDTTTRQYGDRSRRVRAARHLAARLKLAKMNVRQRQYSVSPSRFSRESWLPRYKLVLRWNFSQWENKKPSGA